MVDWQPIETAPKDGTVFIGYHYSQRYDEHHLWSCRWMTVEEIVEMEGGSDDEYDAGWADANDLGEPIFPTHWMPLPEPPLE